MVFATAEWVQDTVGILSPVISALVLALVMYLIRHYLPENVRGQVEASVSEAEAEIKKEIQNGITDRLDTIVKHTEPESKKDAVEPKTVTATDSPTETPFTVPQGE